MPLRKRQDLESFSFGHIYYDRNNPDFDTGICKTERVDQCVRLPDKKVTSLELLLKSGVGLEQTNCKLLDARGTIKLSVEDKKGE